MARQDYRQLTWRQAPFRRFYYRATSRIVLAPLLIIFLILIGVLFYYYSRYAAIIDNGLHGKLFVRSSGIYAAPLTLRVRAAMRNELIAHLRKVGYQEGAASENEKRGRYLLLGNALEIYPGSDTRVDGQRAFPKLRVVFSRGGDVIQTITDLDSRQQMEQAQVEPELISSVVNPEREKRKIIEYKDLNHPKSKLVDAITSIEDRQFFEHPGINWRGVLRALFRDYQAGEWREGGSSITQQLVKNIYLKPERTWKRKFSEAYMSIILEQRLSKEEIMAMYCNQIYLGQRGGFSINGFGEAARAYFGKDVGDLQLHEAALLAGIIRSPNAYSPFSQPGRARERRDLVLDKMVEAGKITLDQARDAKSKDLGVNNAGAVDASDAPYFIDYLTRQLESQPNERDRDVRSLRIYSTIDLELQHAAFRAVSDKMRDVVDPLMKQRGKSAAGLQCALVAMNAKTGDILAMVGGRDYTQSQLNRATDARRQPGSVFKPFVYAAAIALGGDETGNPITTATTFVDEPKTFGGTYSPDNFGDKYELRPMTVRDALVHSKNVITVEIAHTIGFAQVVRIAEKAGLTRVPAVPSVALGVAEATPLQMASAYTAFANQGRRVTPIAIKRVTDKDGLTQITGRAESREVMSPQVAYIMTDMMKDVLDRGTGTRVRQMGFAAPAAGKTGSSRDAWFAGYTPNLVCVVWIGYDDNSDIGLTGGLIAAPIWADFMIRALRIRPELGGEFEDPGDLVTMEIDPASGAPAQGEARRRELFLPGTEPGGGQTLPDHSVPETEPPPSGGDSQRPPPPKPADSDRMATDTGGIDTGIIPLPPEARKTRPRPGAEPTPTPKQSFTGRVKEFFGFGNPAAAKTAPSPTPEATPRPAPKPASTPRPIASASTPKPIASDASAATGAPAATGTTRAAPTSRPASPPAKPKPKPSPRPQVATRPRSVAEKKKAGGQAASKPKSEDRASKSDKDKKTSQSKDRLAAGKKDEKKSDKKAEAKPASKQPETKKPATQLAKASTPAPTPTPTPTPTPAPTIISTTPRGDGTFTLEVCAVSGLLPVPGLCKTVRQRFKLGFEPTKRCSQAHHRGN